MTTLFKDGAERNKALGAWGAVAGSAGAAGVLLGGILTDGLGWEWVLWVNVPVSLIALAFTPGLIPESRSESDDAPLRRRRAVTVTAGLSVLAYALLDASSAGLGLDQDRQPARARGRPDRRLRRDRAALARRRWSRSGSSD